MIRRIAIVCVVLIAVMGATDALAKKKKKPKVLVGPYVGRTSDGIDLTINLNGDRATGSISYCSMTATFTATGSVSAKSFAVTYTDPVSGDSIIASGLFNAKQRSVSGTIAPNGCDSIQQSFLIQR
jgi:hypothetical protein